MPARQHGVAASPGAGLVSAHCPGVRKPVNLNMLGKNDTRYGCPGEHTSNIVSNLTVAIDASRLTPCEMLSDRLRPASAFPYNFDASLDIHTVPYR